MEPNQLMEQWFSRVWGLRDLEAVDELMADDCEVSGLDVAPNNKRGYRRFHRAVLAAFADLRVSVVSMQTKGNTVSGSGRFAGINRLTRESVEFDFTYMARWRNGRMLRADHKLDYLTMLRESGRLDLTQN